MVKVFIGISKLSLELSEYHDFNWLNEVEVFAIFDQQDSGNISFGIIENDERYFIKYAGARNLEYTGDLQAAINRLKEARKCIWSRTSIHFVQKHPYNTFLCYKFCWKLILRQEHPYTFTKQTQKKCLILQQIY
ncbi:hypothetical protein [Psychrobacillus sp. L4]|uniref:hypothetical protein n=1 Tax=Psychrobacillus sp. L4 TaxID=3236892 RepID=UPI0036F3EDA2